MENISFNSRVSLVSIRILLAATVLSLSSVSARADEMTSDEKSIVELLQALGAAFDEGSDKAFRKVYGNDIEFFGRDGSYIKGYDSVVAMFMASPEGREETPARSKDSTYQIAIEGVDADKKLGYAFGRVCNVKGKQDKVILDLEKKRGPEGCDTRWLIISEKGTNGVWRVKLDVDMPYK